MNRLRERAHYDEKTVYSILDQAYVAHVGFTQMNEENEPEPGKNKRLLSNLSYFTHFSCHSNDLWKKWRQNLLARLCIHQIDERTGEWC